MHTYIFKHQQMVKACFHNRHDAGLGVRASTVDARCMCALLCCVPLTDRQAAYSQRKPAHLQLAMRPCTV